MPLRFSLNVTRSPDERCKSLGHETIYQLGMEKRARKGNATNGKIIEQNNNLPFILKCYKQHRFQFDTSKIGNVADFEDVCVCG